VLTRDASATDPALRLHPPASGQVQSQRVVYLAPDCTDSAVKRRARAILGCGHELVSFSFRRDRYNVGVQPDWPNIELGKSTERRLLSRVMLCVHACWTIFRNRRIWREATVIYARNLDLALLACVGRWIFGCRAPLVYEVLDAHPLLTRRGARGAILRWLERRVLKRCWLLVVSSPAYLREYFSPRQGYTGRTFLLENKWPHESVFAGQRKLSCHVAESAPVWTIGWFGNLRCRQSLRILTELADALPDRVRIYMRGCASLLGDGTLQRAIAGRPNMVFDGEYTAPDDFPAIYAPVHFNWCVDLAGGDNSCWLLPNRLYEGGFFGVPALAVADHETGRVVRDRGLGIALELPLSDHLRQLLLNLTRDDYLRLRGKIEALPAAWFVDEGDTARLMALDFAKR
jgi:succinoglycan biosynthesis protein ExoL